MSSVTAVTWEKKHGRSADKGAKLRLVRLNLQDSSSKLFVSEYCFGTNAIFGISAPRHVFGFFQRCSSQSKQSVRRVIEICTNRKRLHLLVSNTTLFARHSKSPRRIVENLSTHMPKNRHTYTGVSIKAHPLTIFGASAR